MKVNIFLDRLNKGLSLVSRVVSTKNQLPVLGNVLISAEKEGLFLSTTNLETAIITRVNASIETEGKTTVPFKQLYETTSLIREEKVELSLEENNFKIKGTKTKSTLSTTPTAEFPPINKSSKTPTLIIDKKSFSEAVGQVVIATSQDESRPLLGGVRFEKTEKGIEIAATDGYRLSVKELTAEKNDMKKNLIFPVKTLIEVVRIASEAEEKVIKVVIDEEKNQANFIFEEAEIISRLLEGEFPNFKKIIPNSYTTKVIFDKEELLNSVKLASVFARESSNIVKIKTDDKKAQLSANAPQVGENSASLEIEKEGEEIEVAFNYRFLSEYLNIVQGERVVFETNGALNPGVFKIEKEDRFLHIIMPVRVQS